MREHLAAFLVALLGSLAAPARAQDIPPDPQTARELEEVCRKAYCRPARKVTMRRDDGTAFEVDVPRLPIVLPNGWITVLTGEVVHVELELDGSVLKRARAVAKPARGSVTATFRLSQEPGAADSVLSVTHGFSLPLKFRLAMMSPGAAGLQPAESCPVKPASVGYERWAQAVFQAVIADVRLLPEGAPLNCQ